MDDPRDALIEAVAPAVLDACPYEGDPHAWSCCIVSTVLAALTTGEVLEGMFKRAMDAYRASPGLAGHAVKAALLAALGGPDQSGGA